MSRLSQRARGPFSSWHADLPRSFWPSPGVTGRPYSRCSTPPVLGITETGTSKSVARTHRTFCCPEVARRDWICLHSSCTGGMPPEAWWSDFPGPRRGPPRTPFPNVRVSKRQYISIATDRPGPIRISGKSRGATPRIPAPSSARTYQQACSTPVAPQIPFPPAARPPRALGDPETGPGVSGPRREDARSRERVTRSPFRTAEGLAVR